MGEITVSSAWLAIGVFVAVCAAIATIWNGIAAWKKLSGAEARREAEARQNNEIADLKNRLMQVEAKIAKIETIDKDIRNDLTETLTVLNGMLMHFISGNDHDRLRDIKTQLDTYMSQR